MLLYVILLITYLVAYDKNIPADSSSLVKVRNDFFRMGLAKRGLYKGWQMKAKFRFILKQVTMRNEV